MLIYDLLKDYAGLNEKEADALFAITDEGNGWRLKARRWLEYSLLKAVGQLTSDYGGEYYTEDKLARFFIPKTDKAKAEQGEGVTPFSVSMDKAKPPQLEFPKNTAFANIPVASLIFSEFDSRITADFELSDLIENVRAYGVLEPILVRQIEEEYEVVAGNRRARAAKAAGLTHVPAVKMSLSDVEALVLQLTENFQRKDLSPEEKSRGLAELAKRTGWKPTEIAEHLKMSVDWVYKYLPDEFKDKKMSELGKLGGEATQEGRLTPSTESEISRQPTPSDIYKNYMFGLRKCEKCGRQEERVKMKIIDGTLVCPNCRGEKPKPPPKQPERKEKAYKETAEFRAAQMQPGVSKMDEAMLIRLQNNKKLREAGWQVEFQKRYLKVLCISDATLINEKLGKEIAFFWDLEELHKDRQLKDDRNRMDAKHLFSIDYQTCPYRVFSEAEQVRLEKLVEQKCLGEP